MDKEQFLTENSHLGTNTELLTLWGITTMQKEKEPVILVKTVKKRIAEKIGITVGSVSYHVCVLRRKGLIKQTGHATYTVP